MEIDDIKTILICVEFKNGNAHQVLSTHEHKKLMLSILSGMDDGLKVSEEIEPFQLQSKPK